MAEQPKPKRSRKAGSLQLGCFAHMKLDQFDLKKPLLAPPLPPYHCVNLHDHWTSTQYQIVIYLEVQPPFLVRPRRSRPRLRERRPPTQRQRPRKLRRPRQRQRLRKGRRQPDKGTGNGDGSIGMDTKQHLQQFCAHSPPHVQTQG